MNALRPARLATCQLARHREFTIDGRCRLQGSSLRNRCNPLPPNQPAFRWALRNRAKPSSFSNFSRRQKTRVQTCPVPVLIRQARIERDPANGTAARRRSNLTTPWRATVKPRLLTFRTLQIAAVRVTHIALAAHLRFLVGLIFTGRRRCGKRQLRMFLQMESVAQDAARHAGRILREGNGDSGEKRAGRRSNGTGFEKNVHGDPARRPAQLRLGRKAESIAYAPPPQRIAAARLLQLLTQRPCRARRPTPRVCRNPAGRSRPAGPRRF
jgi:hypothetical protein